ncbi:MAG TPA: LysR family transcriptional regulator [Methylocella sp.]|nr:LysR family transcriptional regulator [Methylocella sp.]
MAIWAFISLTAANGANIGCSRAAALEGIARYGSITMTAEAMGLSFQQVWSAIGDMNKEFGEVVVTRRGRGSGGARLTPRGEEVLRAFRAVENTIYNVCSKELELLEKLAGENPAAPRPIDHWARLEDPKSWKLQKGQTKTSDPADKRAAQKKQTKKKNAAYGVLSSGRHANSPQKKPGPKKKGTQ